VKVKVKDENCKTEAIGRGQGDVKSTGAKGYDFVM